MRQIIKNNSPKEFKNWKREYVKTRRAPATYNALVKNAPLKRLVQMVLIEEQHYTCCYCGNRIDIDNSHIEHFMPQSKFRKLELTYTNLHASCQYTDSCGHAKKDHYKDIISPLQTDCESVFQYREDGKIELSRTLTDVDLRRVVANTIEKLGLDCDRLRVRRQAAIRGITELGDLSDGDLDALIDSYSREDSNGRYEPFSTALLHVLFNMRCKAPKRTATN